jgi:hypothetical protein
MFRFLIRTILAAALSFAVKQYLEAEVEDNNKKRVTR